MGSHYKGTTEIERLRRERIERLQEERGGLGQRRAKLTEAELKRLNAERDIQQPTPPGPKDKG